MLRRLWPSCCVNSCTSPSLLHDGALLSRRMSTRQAARLRRNTASPTSATTAASAKARPATSSGAASMPSGAGAHAARGHARLTSSATARGVPPRKGSTATSSSSINAKAAATATPSSGTAKPPMRGRFNRLVLERGFFFTVYLYALGESITLTLAYLLHTHQLGIGDAGSWLAALHFPTDRFLNVGPTVYGLQLSPRLLLNYLVANVCTYPLLPLQMRFCALTAPVLQAPFVWVGKALRRSTPAVPKAPTAHS